MPVGNELFRTKLRTRHIEETEFCRACGYDLKGLTSDDRCPECGAAIKSIRSKRKLGETITDAPAAYLNALAMASWTAAVTFVVTIAAYIASSVFEDIAEIRLVWAGSCLFWILAVFLLTVDRQSLLTPRHELQKEWRISRWIARLSQLAWIVMALLAFWETKLLLAANPGIIAVGPRWATVPNSVEIIRMFKGGAYLIGMIGIGFLCLHLATLASWARDDKLETRFRTCTYFLCGGVPLYMIGYALREAPGMIGYLCYGMWIVMGTLMLIAWAFFLIGLWQLGTLCTWALASAAAEQARDARMIARAEEERDRVIQREFSAAPPPVDLRPSGEVPAPPVKPKSPYIEPPQSVEGYEVKDS